ncbi:hypothetical protein FAF44_06040 [Nonomuraea sp. MG754425]|uniref:carbamoyltransferase family protein n=1 Tax=Nonomuraea sp. MG754425 TaxID=2570319 RepID=UPI001F1FD954|nr:carbamoyltransferase C-terminal domain-containing protein [Nonomuraea sp. MG754425]MCF6467964.1 hypothetical protein [Nonomuraea sp. MG754425]
MPLRIVGYNLSHDSSACLVEDGRVTAALALERTTGVKRGIVPPHVYAPAMARLTRDLLASAGLTASGVDYWITTSTESPDQAAEDQLIDTLGSLADRDSCLTLPHPGHHLAHASAAFYTSGLPEAAALVIDSYGSLINRARERESAFSFREGEDPRLVWRNVREDGRIAGRRRDGDLWIPGELSGIGELYRVVTLALGFSENGSTYDDAGKTMGLAAYGRRLSPGNLFVTADGGSLSFENAVDALVDLKVAVRHGAEVKLLPRPADGPIQQFHKDLAAQIQAEFEEACMHLIGDLLTRTGSSNLVLSGGCFLNSMLNARVAREFGLENLHIFPAATDDGNAVGAALYAHHVLLKNPGGGSGGPPMRHTFLGPARLTTAPDRTIDALAREWGLSAVRHHSPRSAAQAGARAIARGEIVGWFQDRAEFGPRALGSRSILCHPGIAGMKDRLNARVKFRESFRPFAASILTEHAARWFDLPARDSPFMLMICPVRPERAGLVAEVVHVDGTSRLQTVGPDLPGGFRALIEEFHRLTGLPLVLNTSLNIRGRPIVEDPRHTMEFLYGTRLDRLFLGDHEIEGPDLAALCPQRSEAVPARQSGPHVGQLLEYATGDLPVRKIAIALGVTEDEAVDLTLDLRRRGLVRWAGVPALAEPRFPLPQYDAEGGG